MTFIQFIFIVLTVVALSVGQILFKMVAGNLDLSVNGFINSLFNLKLLFALCVYFFATIMWLLALKSMPLRVAYPFAALAFFIVPVLAHFFLGETLNWNTFLGAILIAAGVWVSVYR